MCGICGIYNLNGKPADRELLERMTIAMTHRGPDGTGMYISEEIGLGHRRLSIIDIEGGSQPMTNEDGSLCVVFNGEIYNFVELRKELERKGHVFKTRSDTEVIIHSYEQWGVESLNRFNGMFAFILLDCRKRSLIVARDHLGVKPLYYARVGSTYLFGSEIKAILQDPRCPREVDLQALSHLFTFRFVPSPNTIFKDVKKLPPAHVLFCGPEGIKIDRYWKWTPRIRNGRAERSLIQEYQSLLEDAVRLQLRSDVPVGLFLSSGIDSGTILAIMNDHATGPMYTFTIGFEDGEATNETDDARHMARRFGANHTEMIVGCRDYEKYYERYLWDLEEPLGNETAAAFYFVSTIASNHVKVALTGQGADEPWAGYHRYIGVKLSNLYSRLPFLLTDGLIRSLVGLLPRNERMKRGVVALNERDILTRFAKIYSFYSSEMKARLFKDWVKAEILRDSSEVKEALRSLYSDVHDLDPLTQMLYIDTRASLPDDLLMVADKTSMTNSIEARVPFLDVRLVQFIESLPPHLKLRGFTGKYLHKKAVEKWLPREMIYAKKKGFANPIHKWLRGKMLGYVNHCLLSETSAVSQFFSQDYIREVVRLHQQRKEDYLRHIYLLVAFELWHQQFIGSPR